MLDALSPVLDMLYDQFPDCLPFRQPVDPVVLQIPVSSYRIDIATVTVWRETLAEGNVGEFGKSSVIRQTKTIQISTYH